MHNGAYDRLEDVIRHHADPRAALATYRPDHLSEPLQQSARDAAQWHDQILATLSPELAVVPALNDIQLSDLISFLESLSSPSASDLDRWIPNEVPSGLPID